MDTNGKKEPVHSRGRDRYAKACPESRAIATKFLVWRVQMITFSCNESTRCTTWGSKFTRKWLIGCVCSAAVFTQNARAISLRDTVLCYCQSNLGGPRVGAEKKSNLVNSQPVLEFDCPFVFTFRVRLSGREMMETCSARRIE